MFVQNVVLVVTRSSFGVSLGGTRARGAERNTAGSDL